MLEMNILISLKLKKMGIDISDIIYIKTGLFEALFFVYERFLILNSKSEYECDKIIINIYKNFNI